MTKDEEREENKKKFCEVKQYFINEYLNISRSEGKSCKKALKLNRVIHWFDKIYYRAF